MDNNKDFQVLKAESIEAINRSEVDVAISTAKAYPRNIDKAINEILTIATKTKGTAEECFYALPRKERQKDGSMKTKLIEGPSVRLAEIIAFSWGNINFGFRIVSNDGKKITAQAVCHDLERNVRGQIEVDRRITTRDGRTFNEDMQIVTGNAAGSIALRNAILRVIPKAVVADITSNIKQVAIGKINDLETAKKDAINHFDGLGVTEKEILEVLGLKKSDQITVDDIFTLRAIATAIKEGSATVDDTLGRGNQGKPEDQKIGDEISKEIQDDTKKENLGDIMSEKNSNNNQKLNANDKK